MRTTTLVLGCLTAVSVATFLIVACSGDDKPPPAAGDVPAGPSATATALPPATQPDAGGAGGDGGAGDAGDLCGTPVTQQGTETDEWRQPESPPPTYGGKISPGTYTLTALDTYAGDQPPPDGGESAIATKTGKAKRATLVVTAASFTFLEAAGQAGALPADSRRAVTYTVKDATITTQECADGGAGSLTYNANPRSLQLFVDPTHRERYDLVF